MTKKVYYKELVCMNCGHIANYEVPFGVEWNKHIKTCPICGCSNRFSDYYKNIDNFRPTPKYDFLNPKTWMDTDDYENNKLDCRGVEVPDPFKPTEPYDPFKPIASYNPMSRIRTYMQIDRLQQCIDSTPKTNLTKIINRGGLNYYD